MSKVPYAIILSDSEMWALLVALKEVPAPYQKVELIAEMEAALHGRRSVVVRRVSSMGHLTDLQ
jgi:hypothetical protein